MPGLPLYVSLSPSLPRSLSKRDLINLLKDGQHGQKQAPKRFCLLRLATHFVSTVNEAGACIAEVLSSAVVGAVDKEP